MFPHIRSHLSPPLPSTPTPRDFNFDGQADVFWRNSATGGNDIWRSANAALRQITPSVPVLAWLGALFMVLGVVSLFTPPALRDLWLAAGFGALQIGFGAYIARNHGG